MMILPSLKGPSDLSSFSLEELALLAEMIRTSIIDVMAINGGHLGSNLGIVELTIALHRIFSSPVDRFIFDVSHQSYPHKMLTGRFSKFSTIRQQGGLSGFTHPGESPHDHFFAGHAGSALSLALGIAKERDLSGETFHILPILGDASLTCGLTFEAFNNIPTSLTNFSIVLNDNNMSISDNVGALTRLLEKQNRETAQFFESFGLSYVGPIDGHNLNDLLTALKLAKGAKRATLIHVITTKGKGLTFAEENPIPWHGCAPFDKVTGKKVVKAPTKPKFPEIFGRHLLEMMDNDSQIITVTPATPLGSCISQAMAKYPNRCIDVGIAEGHAVTFSGALASSRTKKVVCSVYSTFLQRAFDNLFHDVCLQRAPVFFALDRSGIASGDGATHHGIYDIAFLHAMPHLVICQPRNGHLLKELMNSAFSWNLPVVIRYPNMETDAPPIPLSTRPLGKGELLEMGSDIALIALGHFCSLALEVSSLLKLVGLSVTVIDPIFVKPIDETLLSEVLKTHRYIATIEEHAVNSGLGAIISQYVAKSNKNVRLRLFGIPDLIIHHGAYSQILTDMGLDPDSIAKEIAQEYSRLCPPL